MWSSSALLVPVRSNNEAVRLLEKGHYEAAIHCLANAITVTRQALCAQRDSSLNSSPSPKKSRTQSFPTQIKIERRPVLTLKTNEDSLDGDSSSAEGKGYVFHYVFQIIEQQSVDAWTDIWNKISGILVFNLAITHHMIGEMRALDCNGTQQKVYLLKARRLYEHAYLVFIQNSVIVDFTIPMAILNNLASIHTTMGNAVQANKSWQNLLTLLVGLTSMSSSSFSSSLGDDPLTRGALAGFISNLCHLLLADVLSAPAA